MQTESMHLHSWMIPIFWILQLPIILLMGRVRLSPVFTLYLSSYAHVWKFLEMELPTWCRCLSPSLLSIARVLPRVNNPIHSLPPMSLTSCFSMFNSGQYLVFSDLNNTCQPASGGMIFHYYLNFLSSDYKWVWETFHRAC